MQIWSYPLKPTNSHTINIPVGSKIFGAFVKDGEVSLVAQVDETKHREDRYFNFYAERTPIPEISGKYINTVNTGIGRLHMFEVVLPKLKLASE